MGSCSEDPHLYWVSWLLGFFILLGVRSTGAKGSGTKDSEAFVSLKEIQGGSVLFHVIMKPGVDPRAVVKEITWSFGHLSDYRVMLHVYNGTDSPKWVSLHDKYKQRIYMPNMTTLMIENLNLGDSGEYQARVTLPEGREYIQTFRLIVYETIPLPQVLTKYLSTTHGWCNVTLECNVSARATENLKITWESKGLPKDLEQRETPRPDTNPWTLAVSLPLSQPQSILSASITCVVSNPKDQKNATLDLGEVCVRVGEKENDKNISLGIILGAFVAVLVTLGAGLFLWKTRRKKKKMEPERGPGLQEDCRDNDGDLYYAMGIRGQHMEEKETFPTVYSEVHKPGQAINI
ncbi:SLAM family member 8-like isoform X2 [Trichechus manatus latirostris]|uniref:SLAM family member 8-like isoform X2 n=1 Tax=Trichechus manatus latirostris TaxID=127582 RepID=A0A2Y9QDS3_TRIMA|nr:SLAM family member 8-like isoform X2 [Trichechus manatus latirostris]